MGVEPSVPSPPSTGQTTTSPACALRPDLAERIFSLMVLPGKLQHNKRAAEAVDLRSRRKRVVWSGGGDGRPVAGSSICRPPIATEPAVRVAGDLHGGAGCRREYRHVQLPEWVSAAAAGTLPGTNRGAGGCDQSRR